LTYFGFNTVLFEKQLKHFKNENDVFQKKAPALVELEPTTFCTLGSSSKQNCITIKWITSSKKTKKTHPEISI
jgi:hypothetical protein